MCVDVSEEQAHAHWDLGREGREHTNGRGKGKRVSEKRSKKREKIRQQTSYRLGQRSLK